MLQILYPVANDKFYRLRPFFQGWHVVSFAFTPIHCSQPIRIEWFFPVIFFMYIIDYNILLYEALICVIKKASSNNCF